MKFKTLGNPKNPAAIFIHAMFFSEAMFHTISSRLEDDYYIILPTLDGHDADQQTTFVSAQEEARKLTAFLDEEKITDVQILVGTSLGGIIAFELFRQGNLKIANVFLDGAPFIRLPQIRISIMAKVFKGIAHKSAKHPDKPNILDKLYPAHASEMKKICGNMTDETLDNLTKACYTYELPDNILPAPGQTVTFLYGTEEKAKVCIPSLKKYTNCRLIVKEGYQHCEFLAKEPDAYARMLKMQDN